MREIRLLVGATLATVGAASLYNALWFMLTFPESADQLKFQALLWLWPLSVIVLLTGLLVLPTGRGRTISWCCFILFVLATGIHLLIQDFYFDDRLLWW